MIPRLLSPALLAFLSLLSGTSVAAAQAPAAFVERFVPTSSELRARREAQLSQALVRLFRAEAGAPLQVEVSLPDPSAAALDQRLPPPAILARLPAESALNEAQLRVVAQALAPELTGARLTVIRSGPAALQASVATSLVRVGPFAVAMGSAPALRWSLAALLTLIGVLSALLVYTARRARST